MIVCGWSGEWDIALADAIIRNTRHRFSTYWMAYGPPSARATDIINHRHATVLNIKSANEAFDDLALKVEALEGQRLTEPISPRLAIVTMKKYLVGNQHPIQPQDFVVKELQRVRNNLGPQHFPPHEQPNQTTYHERLERMEALCASFVPIVMTGAYWGDEKYDPLWKRCVETLARTEVAGSTSWTAWSSLQYYPATLVLYAAGIAAIGKGRYSLLKLLLEDSIGKQFRQKDLIDGYPIWRILNAMCCFPRDDFVFLPEGQRPTAGSDRIAKQLRPIVSEVLGEDDEFDNLFDELELIIALVSADQSKGQGVAMGRFVQRLYIFPDDRTPLSLLANAIENQKTNHPLLIAGMFGYDLGRLEKALQRVGALAQKALEPSWYW